MSDPKTEALLRRFLEEDLKARANGISLEALYKVVLDMAADRLADRKAAKSDREAAAEDRRSVATLSGDVQRHGRRIRAIERQLETVSTSPDVPDWRPDPREITGSHDLAAIKAAARREVEHDDMLAKTVWWRENLGKTVLTIFAALLIAGLTACGTIVLSRMSTPTMTTVPK